MKRYWFLYQINEAAAAEWQVDPWDNISVYATSLGEAWKMVYQELAHNGDIEALDSIELEHVS